jgi:putative chitinase
MVSTEAVAAAMGAGKFAEPIEQACIQFGITTTLQKAHFLGQIAHESGNFVYSRELWGPTRAQSGYEGRKDLGNTEPGDGIKFKGRGLIQITGRANYRDYSLATYGDLRAVENPKMLEGLPDAALCAGWYWQTRNINPLADRDDLEAVTRKINGGINGLDDRRVKVAKAKKLFASMIA